MSTPSPPQVADQGTPGNLWLHLVLDQDKAPEWGEGQRGGLGAAVGTLRQGRDEVLDMWYSCGFWSYLLYRGYSGSHEVEIPSPALILSSYKKGRKQKEHGSYG